MSDEPDVHPSTGSPLSLPEFTRRTGVVVGIIAFSVVAFMLMAKAAVLFLLFFAGVLGAVFVRSIAHTLTNRTPLPSAAAVPTVLLTLVGGGGAFVWAALPEAVTQTTNLLEMMPDSIAELEHWLQASPLAATVDVKAGDSLAQLSQEGLSQLSGAIDDVLSLAGTAVLVIFTAVYLSLQPRPYLDGFVQLVPLSYQERMREVLSDVGDRLSGWLYGRLISMATVGLLTSFGLWLLDIPMALYVGAVAGLLSFVPVVGPLLSAIPAALLALLQGPTAVVYVAALYLCIQSLENYVLMPVIEQRTVNLPPVLIVFVQILFGLMFGVPGILLASPILVVLVVILHDCYVTDVLEKGAARWVGVQ